MPSTTHILASILIAAALFGCKPVNRTAATQPATVKSSPQGMANPPGELPSGDVVFTRNLGRPWGSYDVLPEKYRLGTASIRRPPKWWIDLAASHRISGQATEFPLAFVGRWFSEHGAERLVVLQLRHRFSGDGFLTPGPALWLAAYVFEQMPSGKWSLVSSNENAMTLHSMQNARLSVGKWKEKPRTIVLQVEQQAGGGKMTTSNVTATISSDGKVAFSPAGNY